MRSEPADAPSEDASAGACCAEPPEIEEDAVLGDVRLLSATGNDTRYELLRRIAGVEDEICVCELEPAVGVGQSAVSQALSRLSEAGLVTRRKEGSWRYYDTTPAADALLATLDEIRATDGEARTDE